MEIKSVGNERKTIDVMSKSNNIRMFDLLSKLKYNKTELKIAVFSIIIKEKNRNFQKRKVLLPCGQQGRGEGNQKGFGSDDSKSNSEISRLK